MGTTGTVEKGWGREIIFASTPKYCGKLLVFDKAGSKCSMHYHVDKDETWYVQQGSFQVNYINTFAGTRGSRILTQGSTWVNHPGSPHQLEALEDNSVIFEVSTEDKCEDNFRVEPGDSQK